MFSRAIGFIIIVILLTACSNREQHAFIFPSVETQQLLISTDTVDAYFEQVRKVDMVLQLGLPISGREDTISFFVDSSFFTGLRRRYSESLRESVLEFSPDEKQRLTPILNRMSRNLELLNQSFIHQPFFLVKTDGRHYGEGTWFTRQGAIVVPKSAISNLTETALTSVLYHEIFHILSRYHPELRETLYYSIGFGRPKYQVVLPPSLDSHVLLNPDGVDFQYVFKFEPGLVGMPVIYAANLESVDASSAFFDHLAFAFFPIENGKLVTEPLNHESFPAFRHNIGTVTNYIIHPDEILADYFAEIMLRHYENATAPKLIAHDEAILQQIHRILENYKAE